MDFKSVHYTEKEKIILALLIKEHSLIENKKTDAATALQKHVAWESITQEYNRQPEVTTTRNGKQLKTLWKNLKQKKRKHQALLTGGGPPEKKVEDSGLDVVPFMDVVLRTGFDSGAAFINVNDKRPLKVEENADHYDEHPTCSMASPGKEMCEESNLRLQRIKNQIAADEELKNLKIKIALEELKKMEYEAELARLTLQKFKEDNL